ncbi:MAG: EamA family transporter [Candidatus Jorgensenbacteria bacterium]|nr:EamA family transporter [Candidatus Jorgensenbacteria bacterium]
MNWIPVALIAYLANAGAAVTDKFLLRRLIPHPAVYAFFVSLMGGAVIVAAPFVLEDAPATVLVASFFSALAFTGALFFYYTALKHNEASRVVPLVGSMTPVVVLILASIFLGETLGVIQLVGFALVVIGTAVLAEEGNVHRRLAPKAVALGVLAASLFAASHVAVKYVYLVHPFASGLVWRGLGGVAAALILFLIPLNRRRIVAEIRNPEVETGAVFFLGQGFAVTGFLLLNYAFSLGPVSLVNALSGVQYVFLFLAMLILSRFAPRVVKEPQTKREVAVKGIGIVVIGAGLAALFL